MGIHLYHYSYYRDFCPFDHFDPHSAATKMDIGIAPCTEGALMFHQDLSGRPVNQSCTRPGEKLEKKLIFVVDAFTSLELLIDIV